MKLFTVRLGVRDIPAEDAADALNAFADLIRAHS